MQAVIKNTESRDTSRATVKYMEDPKQTSYDELACSAEFAREIHYHLIVLLVLNGFVAITAFLGNTLILVALHKETSLHAPSKRLSRNLTTTDLYPERTMEYLHLRIGCFQYDRPYFGWCVFVYTDRHKRGQVSCPVIWTQIQISCNFKAHISHCSCFLGCLHYRSDNDTLE